MCIAPLAWVAGEHTRVYSLPATSANVPAHTLTRHSCRSIPPIPTLTASPQSQKAWGGGWSEGPPNWEIGAIGWKSNPSPAIAAIPSCHICFIESSPEWFIPYVPSLNPFISFWLKQTLHWFTFAIISRFAYCSPLCSTALLCLYFDCMFRVNNNVLYFLNDEEDDEWSNQYSEKRFWSVS